MTKITSLKDKALGVILLLVTASLIGAAVAAAQGAKSNRIPETALGSAFIYQGQLNNNGAPVNGNCDIAFGLYDFASGGSLVSGPITPTVTITNGLFTAPLDFGVNTFNGQARWLNLQIRCPAGIGSFMPLTSRQPITPAPYALYSANADTLGVWPLLAISGTSGRTVCPGRSIARSRCSSAVPARCSCRPPTRSSSPARTRRGCTSGTRGGGSSGR